MVRTQQLDLFSTVGAGDRRTERIANRITRRSSIGTDKARVATSVKNVLRKNRVRVKQSSFDSKGG